MQRLRWFLSAAAVAWSWSPVSVWADEGSKGDAPKKPGETYQAIVAEFDKAMQEFMTAYRATKTDEERQVVFEKYPRAEKYAHRLFALAEKEPADPAAIDCLLWIARNCRTGKEFEKSLEVLLKD